MDGQGDVGLRLEQRGAARWLFLDRPQRRNALTVGLVAALADAVADLDPEQTRAVVITGSPPCFCSGGDLTDLGTVAEGGALAVSEVIYGQFHRLVAAIAAAPVPVVAAINGAALGAGLDLALTCDLRYATPDSTFASSWVNLALVPGMGGAHLLTRAIGPARAAEVALLGETFGAGEALGWGLLNGVVPAPQLDDKVAEVTDRIAGLSATAIARTKAALRRARDAGLAEELATLGAVQGGLLTGPDFRAATERYRR
jgi:2-(1,2-epoxy-1,2-dihydrophenyl)acetyl-CoA isomerase